MRKLFLLVCVMFVGYYGISLWPLADANWVPLAMLITTLVLGLAHMPVALGVTLVLVLLTGNPQLLCQIAGLEASGNAAKTLMALNPAEPLLLGLFAAWVLLRFFGNPELDYEYHKATAVRALHFPVGVVCFTAVLASVYAVVFSQNVFTVSFNDGMREAVLRWPFGVLQGGAGVAPIRAVVRLLECVAVYTIVANELRTMQQVRVFAGMLVMTGLVVALLGFVQAYKGWYTGSLWQATKEMQATFPDPNSCAVFLLALLPLCGAMIVKGRELAILGSVCAVVFLVAIVLTGAKMATMVSVGMFAAVAVAAAVQALRQRSYWKLGVVGVLVLVVLVGYITARVAHSRHKEGTMAASVVSKVDGTASAFAGVKWTPQDLNRRTCFKLGDFATAIAMVNPMTTGQESRIISGVGYGGFKEKYNNYRAPWASRQQREGASNMFLQTLAETGIFGALALMLIVACAVVWTLLAARTLKAPVFASSVAAALLVLVLGCMTENAFLRPQIQVVFWTLVALCMVLTSLVSHTSSGRDFYLLKFVTVILMLGGWTFCVYPEVMAKRADAAEIKEAAQHCAEVSGYRLPDLLKAFETTADFQFRTFEPRRNGVEVRRYMGKDAVVLTKVAGPVLDLTIDVYLPKISKAKRQIVRLMMDEEPLRDVVFTNGILSPNRPIMTESCHVELDISQSTNLVRYVNGKRYAVLRLAAERTFVPGDENEQWKKSGLTNDMGAFISTVTWKDKVTPKEPEARPAPATNTSAATQVAPPVAPPTAPAATPGAPPSASRVHKSAPLATTPPPQPGTNATGARPPVPPPSPDTNGTSTASVRPPAR